MFVAEDDTICNTFDMKSTDPITNINIEELRP